MYNVPRQVVDMNRFKELQVWQLSIGLAVMIYDVTKSFPKEEKFGLSSQINRSVISISSNIAEGAGRNSNKEFIQFLSIALGSSFEVESQLIISEKIGFINIETLNLLLEQLHHIQNMIIKLKKSL